MGHSPSHMPHATGQSAAAIPLLPQYFFLLNSMLLGFQQIQAQFLCSWGKFRSSKMKFGLSSHTLGAFLSKHSPVICISKDFSMQHCMLLHEKCQNWPTLFFSSISQFSTFSPFSSLTSIKKCKYSFLYCYTMRRNLPKTFIVLKF